MEPLPNIGLFFCKGNKKTVRMFTQAWQEYREAPVKGKKHMRGKDQPGKDQNKVLGAMKRGRYAYGLKWDFISNKSAILQDKVFKFHNRNIDIGGEASAEILSKLGAVATHTTCYEQKAKASGLKAASAYWNPIYYDPDRLTITKQLLYTGDKQLRDELQTLIWLAKQLNRSLILPNLLGSSKALAPVYKGRRMWPGFRLAFTEKQDAHVLHNILEPAFYWRVERDYAPVPPPKVIAVDKTTHVTDLVRLIQDAADNYPRIVLVVVNHVKNVHQKVRAIGSEYSGSHLAESSSERLSFVTKLYDNESENITAKRIIIWAEDSVGLWGPYNVETRRYFPISPLTIAGNRVQDGLDGGAAEIVQSVRPCINIFRRDRGNRSCFDKCD